MTKREAPTNRAAESFFRAGVVVVLYNQHTGKCIAGERTKPPEGTWQFPQGGIEAGQTPLETAIQEVWEETGIRVTAEALLFAPEQWISYELPAPEPFHGRGQSQRWFVFSYDGPAELQNPSDAEFLSLAYMDFQDVIAKTAPFRVPAYKQFAKLFANWQQASTG